MPIFLSLDEIFIFVFDFVNFCAQNMKYTMKCVSTVFLYRDNLIMKG